MEGSSADLKSDQETLAQLCYDFGSDTTMHGLRRAVAGRSRRRRNIWKFLVLCGAGWAVYQLVSIMAEYYSYPVSTQVRIEYARKMVFPGVNICNLNHFRLSGMMKFFKDVEQPTVKLLSYADKIKYLTTFLVNRSPEEIARIGYSIDDMLISCSFNKKPCGAQDFVNRSSIESGNCFTFAATSFKRKERYTKKTGPSNGLILELDIDHGDYFPLTASTGLLISIHNGSEFPFPSESGLVAAPGFTVSIGIRKVESYQLPPPYGNCMDGRRETTNKQNLFSNFGYTYTEHACKQSCAMVAILKQCSCYAEDVPGGVNALAEMAHVAKDNHSFAICNSNHTKCLTGTLSETHVFSSCTESCPPACERVIYDRVGSQASWPAEAYLPNFLQKVNESLAKKGKTLRVFQNPMDFVRKNFLRLEIYYESMEYEIQSSYPTYDLNKAMGDIGGQLGLFLGFSLLTALEFVEFAFNLILFVVKKIGIRDKIQVKSMEIV